MRHRKPPDPQTQRVPRADISFRTGESLACTVSGKEKGEPEEKTADDDISYALLNALLGNAEFVKDGAGTVQTIAFEA